MNELHVTKDGRKLSFGAAVRRLNPHLFAAEKEKAACNERVDRLVDTVTKQDAVSPLEPVKKASRCRKGRVAIVVTITSYRRAELDEDNLVAGAKPLRDCIASALGLDDADKRLRFEYRQVVTTGVSGTHVVITTV